MAKKQTRKSSVGIKASELSNEELLEQIMSKKRNKKRASSNKSSNKDSSVVVDKPSKNEVKKTIKKELTNDEIYEQIKAKRNKKKTKEESLTSQKKASEEKIETKEVTEKSKIKQQEDLIITREIRFDDEFDLNNKKNLKKLREAIEEFDRLENLEEQKEEEPGPIQLPKKREETVSEKEKVTTRTEKYKDKDNTQDIKLVTRPKQTRKRRIDKRKLLIGISIILVLILIFSFIFYFINSSNDNDQDNIFNISDEKDKELQRQKELLEKYNSCLNREYSEETLSEDVKNKMNELTSYLSETYEVSVKYEDLSSGFVYTYNSDKVYYAASTIKSLDALYIYTKAAQGEISLDETMEYTAKYKWSSSKEMSKLAYGTKVTLRDLVKYAVVVSDNSAHQMLVSYIGRNNLKEFGQSLGAKNTLVGADNFGSIDVNDAIIYMKAVNDFINNNETLGEELKSYFVQAEQNDLELPDYGIEAAHKYGQYSYYYHDIGIVYDDSPYVVAILTLEGGSNFEEKVKDINKHIYEMHKFYNDKKKELCDVEVYGN